MKKHGKVRCRHYWSYPHTIWQGRRESNAEVVIARYCMVCHKKQIAYVNKWHKIPAAYPDVLKEIKSEMKIRK